MNSVRKCETCQEVIMLRQLTVTVLPLREHPCEVSVEPQTWLRSPLLSRAWQTESGD